MADVNSHIEAVVRELTSRNHFNERAWLENSTDDYRASIEALAKASGLNVAVEQVVEDYNDSGDFVAAH